MYHTEVKTEGRRGWRRRCK